MTEIPSNGRVLAPFNATQFAGGDMKRINEHWVVPQKGVYSASATVFVDFGPIHLIDEWGTNGGNGLYLQIVRTAAIGGSWVTAEVLATAPCTVYTGPHSTTGPYAGSWVAGSFVGNISSVAFAANENDRIAVLIGRNEPSQGQMDFASGHFEIHWVGVGDAVDLTVNPEPLEAIGYYLEGTIATYQSLISDLPYYTFPEAAVITGIRVRDEFGLGYSHRFRVFVAEVTVYDEILPSNPDITVSVTIPVGPGDLFYVQLDNTDGEAGWANTSIELLGTGLPGFAGELITSC